MARGLCSSLRDVVMEIMVLGKSDGHGGAPLSNMKLLILGLEIMLEMVLGVESGFMLCGIWLDHQLWMSWVTALHNLLRMSISAAGRFSRHQLLPWP